jgi:hypothetical protein
MEKPVKNNRFCQGGKTPSKIAEFRPLEQR